MFSELLVILKALPLAEKAIGGGVIAVAVALLIWLGYHYSRTFSGFIGLSIVLLALGVGGGFYLARRGVQVVRGKSGLLG